MPPCAGLLLRVSLDHYKELLLNLGKSEDKGIDSEAIDDAGKPNQSDGASDEQEEEAEDNEIVQIVKEIFANATTFIKKPATLTSLVTAIDRLDWYSACQEGLGDLYEELL